METEERLNFLHSAIAVSPYYFKSSGLTHFLGLTNCTLQDSIFTGQELRLIKKYYEFPTWQGTGTIGTARYCEEINADKDILIKRGDIFMPGNGIAIRKYLVNIPEDAEKLRRLKKVCRTPADLSHLAAYIQAARASGCDFKRNKAKARKASTIRLGWPENMIEIAESMRKSLESLAVSA